MNLHLQDYEKLTTPNAKMLALRKAKEAIEEEEREIKSHCVMCECGYLMTKDEYDRKREIYISPDRRKSADWTFCPVCGKMMSR